MATTSHSRPGPRPVLRSARPNPSDQRAGKQVTFELILPSTQRRARLPLRVFIHPHDTTESIISTTKNFYGLYNPAGVSFEDKDGNTLIAAYDNFEHLMTVYVRSIHESDEPTDPDPPAAITAPDPKRPRLNSPSGRPSYPPTTVAITSTTTTVNPAAAAPTTSSNSFSRRKVAKFNSSELPLFVPSQISTTASASSAASPSRNHNSFATPGGIVALPSPRSATSSARVITAPGVPSRSSSGSAAAVALATPDPSLAHESTISDEDVALQLMRLGELSGAIPRTRPDHVIMEQYRLRHRERSPCCAATEPDPPSDIESMLAHDDGYRSADSAGYSSDPDSGSDSGRAAPARPLLRPIAPVSAPPHPPSKDSVSRVSMAVPNLVTPGPVPAAGHTSTATVRPVPAVASLAAAHSIMSKPTIGSASANTNNHDDDDDDLSTKPRCQRCRKSKKGCDRQRPCMRCRDAGIGADGCISEEEGNGRKGRYGRFMGIGVKKAAAEAAVTPTGSVSGSVDGTGSDSKKRKR